MTSSDKWINRESCKHENSISVQNGDLSYVKWGKLKAVLCFVHHKLEFKPWYKSNVNQTYEDIGFYWYQSLTLLVFNCISFKFEKDIEKRKYINAFCTDYRLKIHIISLLFDI